MPNLPIDVAVVLCAFIGWAALWYLTELPPPPSALSDAQRQLIANSVIEACKAGLTVAGIFFPILVAALSLTRVVGNAKPQFTAATIDNLRITTVWVALSLAAGVWNLGRFPSIVETRLLNRDRWTGAIGAAQLVTLIAAIVRSALFLIWNVFS